MKRVLTFFTVAILTLLLAACGSDNNNMDNTDGDTNNAPEVDSNGNNNQATDDASTDDMQGKMADLPYTDFELEVDYGADQEYEAEIEQSKEKGEIKADLEDELSGKDFDGQEAFDEIFPLVEKLTISQETEKDDAIEQVLEVFDLDDDYEKFELEITFSDGTKIEFEDR